MYDTALYEESREMLGAMPSSAAMKYHMLTNTKPRESDDVIVLQEVTRWQYRLKVSFFCSFIFITFMFN